MTLWRAGCPRSQLPPPKEAGSLKQASWRAELTETAAGFSSGTPGGYQASRSVRSCAGFMALQLCRVPGEAFPFASEAGAFWPQNDQCFFSSETGVCTHAFSRLYPELLSFPAVCAAGPRSLTSLRAGRSVRLWCWPRPESAPRRISRSSCRAWSSDAPGRNGASVLAN